MFRPTFVLPDFDGGSNPVQSRRYLECLTRCLTDIDLLYLLNNPSTPLLYHAGVRYVRDEPGQEDWQAIPEVMKRRKADCKSLAAWRAAELLARGHKAFVQYHWRDSPQGATFHIYVQLENGEMEDPSRILGMTRE